MHPRYTSQWLRCVLTTDHRKLINVQLLCTVSFIAGEASQAKLTIFDVGGMCMAVGGLLLYSVREEETDKNYRDRLFELEKYEKLKETADVFSVVSMDDAEDDAPVTYVRRRANSNPLK